MRRTAALWLRYYALFGDDGLMSKPATRRDTTTVGRPARCGAKTRGDPPCAVTETLFSDVVAAAQGRWHELTVGSRRRFRQLSEVLLPRRRGAWQANF
jgi:hypothetical protein